MMVKKFYIAFAILIASLSFVGCAKKQVAPKQMTLPVAHAVADSVVRFRSDKVCHIHVDFTYLKGSRYAAVNDSLLRMGTLQPNYFAIQYEKLEPISAVRYLVERYAKEYSEIAQWLHDRERARSQLNWELSIDTKIMPGKGKNLVYLSHILIKTGETTSEYSLAHNFDPDTGREIRLNDAFDKEEQAELTTEIIRQLADRLGLDEDDTKGIRKAGFFVGIDAYPSENFILHDDSVTFIYTPGEINPKEVRLTLKK
ncbi:RsiV family protein [Prevotella brunnea]|uniref:RsiV family protein n=1 Tax=Prevotella brunnea TaxID=2508867 RepID=UPI00283AB880|nr:RsiV family protein [Prevotella brunnea]